VVSNDNLVRSDEFPDPQRVIIGSIGQAYPLFGKYVRQGNYMAPSSLVSWMRVGLGPQVTRVARERCGTLSYVGRVCNGGERIELDDRTAHATWKLLVEVRAIISGDHGRGFLD
jgi:hypothetical protein